MDRKQIIVKSRERRSHRDPKSEQSTHKTGQAPARYYVRKQTLEATPASQIDQRGGYENERDWRWDNPRLQNGFDCGRHRWLMVG
jgi:hypothetical protein